MLTVAGIDAWVPFLQTLLWIAFVAGTLAYFNTQVGAILEAIRDRISKGSSVKVGPVEIGESPPAQSLASQQAEITREAKESLSSDDTESSSASSLPDDIRYRVLLAEDLAIREIQSEYGVSISRQVAMGSYRLDGTFTVNGRGYGVEVKYVKTSALVVAAKRAISRVQDVIPFYAFKRFTLILALVYDAENIDIDREDQRIREIVKQHTGKIEIRTYAYSSLVRKYGL